MRAGRVNPTCVDPGATRRLGSVRIHFSERRFSVVKRRFHLWPLTRRATLRISLSAAVTALFPSWTASAQTQISDELQARFLGWTRTATGFADLPPDAARACVELVLRSGVSPQTLSNLAPDAYGGT